MKDKKKGTASAIPELYSDILAKIMTGELQPGQRLIEEELARAYRVSRTPVREVFFALAKDGLVERVQNRGARVVSFTPDDVEEIFEIRMALECLSIRNAVRNLPLSALSETEHQLEQLVRHEGKQWTERHGEIDFELHRLIVSYSGNRRLMTYLDNISMLIHSLRLLGLSNPDHARQARDEHLAIVRALLRRDAELAERLLAEHLENSKRNALEIFLRNRNNTKDSAPAGEFKTV